MVFDLMVFLYGISHSDSKGFQNEPWLATALVTCLMFKVRSKVLPRKHQSRETEFDCVVDLSLAVSVFVIIMI